VLAPSRGPTVSTFSDIDRLLRRMNKDARAYAVGRVLARLSLGDEFDTVKKFGPEDDTPADDDIDKVVEMMAGADSVVRAEALAFWRSNQLVERVRAKQVNGYQNVQSQDMQRIEQQVKNKSLSAVSRVLLACALLVRRIQAGAPLRTGLVRKVLEELQENELAKVVTQHVSAMADKSDPPLLERLPSALPRDEVCFRITPPGTTKVMNLLS
jgi:hypothetical protein